MELEIPEVLTVFSKKKTTTISNNYSSTSEYRKYFNSPAIGMEIPKA